MISFIVDVPASNMFLSCLCIHCQGSGVDPFAFESSCEDCNGTGKEPLSSTALHPVDCLCIDCEADNYPYGRIGQGA